MLGDSFFTKSGPFDQLRERFLTWRANGYSDCDEHLPPVFDQLAKWASVAPVFSCEGHKKDEDFYLMLAVTEDGFLRIASLYDAMRERLVESDLEWWRSMPPPDQRENLDLSSRLNISPNNWRLSFTTRGFPLKGTADYPALILTASGMKTQELRLKFIESLIQELKKLNS
jgi:hypothetical protein